MRESAPIEGFEPNVRGTNDYADTAGSDVVVITAGLPRQPGMSRMDLLDKNAASSATCGQGGRALAPAVLIVVTNPLDEMTYLASEVSGFPKERVMGMAGVLDSSRLRYFIAEELGVSPSKVEAMTLGSHGEAMVPLPRQATVDGKPLADLVDEGTLEHLYARTRDAGAEIVAFLKKGSAYYAPSAAIAQMVNAIAGDTKEVLPVCAWCTGQYGISDVYVGVPVKLGRGGVDEIVELDLNEEELAALRKAAEGIRAKCADLSRSPDDQARLTETGRTCCRFGTWWWKRADAPSSRAPRSRFAPATRSDWSVATAPARRRCSRRWRGGPGGGGAVLRRETSAFWRRTPGSGLKTARRLPSPTSCRPEAGRRRRSAGGAADRSGTHGLLAQRRSLLPVEEEFRDAGGTRRIRGAADLRRPGPGRGPGGPPGGGAVRRRAQKGRAGADPVRRVRSPAAGRADQPPGHGRQGMAHEVPRLLSGGLIVVSHDLVLLDRSVTRVLHLDGRP